MIRQPGRQALRGFWQRRQAAAQGRRFSGYLADESPEIIGQRRFDGEWRQLKTWLERARLNRNACLDLGCGSGEWTLRLAGEFGKVRALDWAASMASATAQRARAAGLDHVRASRGEITALRGRGQFDLVFIGGVLMYSTDSMLTGILRKAAALLKPQGLLILRESTRREGRQDVHNARLKPGLWGSAAANRRYAAIYRSAGDYSRQVRLAGLELLLEKTNRHYKFSGLAEARLQSLNRLAGGALQRRPSLANRCARMLFAASAFTLWPEYLWGQYVQKSRWPLDNRWWLAKKA